MPFWRRAFFTSANIPSVRPSVSLRRMACRFGFSQGREIGQSSLNGPADILTTRYRRGGVCFHECRRSFFTGQFVCRLGFPYWFGRSRSILRNVLPGDFQHSGGLFYLADSWRMDQCLRLGSSVARPPPALEAV